MPDISRPRLADQSDAPKHTGFHMLLGCRTKVWEEGYGEVELTLGPQHLNSH